MTYADWCDYYGFLFAKEVIPHDWIKEKKEDMLEQGTLGWWQYWLILMITLNTFINVIVFFKHRFKGKNDGG